MNFPYNWCKNLFYLCFLFNLIVFNNCVKLRGVTLENWPYVDKYEDKNGDTVYDGFAIELIEKISKFSGFDYELYDVPDGRHGIYDHQTGRIDGMIGELHYNRADFAVADLTVTEDRKRLVEFTEPFMSSNIAAIVNKKYGEGLQTFSDLYYKANLTYGVISHSATHHYFYNTKDSILRKMYNTMEQRGDVYVRNRVEGIERVNTTAYAFISESASLEFVANVNCDLMVIYDKNNEFRDSKRDYAIALKKGSKYVNAFNFAIIELNRTGELEELRDNYWVNECKTSLAEVDINASNPLDLLSINTYLSMFLITRIVFN